MNSLHGTKGADWAGRLVNAAEEWRRTGDLSALSLLPEDMPWSEALQSDLIIEQLCAAPELYSDCLTALSAARPADTALLEALDLLANMLTRKSDSSFAAGYITRASDFFTAALRLKYAGHLRDRRFKYLERVNFEITSVCNLRCKFCSFQSGRRKKHLDKEFYRKVLLELAQKVPHLKRLALYMSGESLLHPDFIGILQVTREIKDSHPQFRPLTYLHTNGMLWTPAMNDRILATGALDQVTWSIDGVDAASFEEMRRGAKFKKVMGHFEYFLAHHPPTVTAMVNNIVERDAGVPCPEMQTAFAKADAVNTLEPKTLNTPVDTAIPTQWQGRHAGFCEYIFHTVVVTTDGRMSLCCVDYNSVNAFGDIARDGFEFTYYGPERERLLRLMADGRRRDIEGCRECRLLRNAWSTDRNLEKRKGQTDQKNEAHVLAWWRTLKQAENVRCVALFGAGKYTAWLNGILPGADGPEVSAVLDDQPTSKPAFFGKPVLPANAFDPKSVDAIVLSTDSLSQAMRARCTELYGGFVKIIDPCQDFSFE